jgi:hypothetical protein
MNHSTGDTVPVLGENLREVTACIAVVQEEGQTKLLAQLNVKVKVPNLKIFT